MLKMSKSINVYVQSLQDVPADIYKQLYKLNYGQRGSMRDHLVNYRHADTDSASVCYIKGRKNLIKGWALMFEGLEKNEKEVHLYVKKVERNKGYGSALAQVARKQFPNKKLYGYHEYSTIFERSRIRDAGRQTY